MIAVRTCRAERIHLGHRLADFADQGDSVEAWFDNGAPHLGRRAGRRRRHPFDSAALGCSATRHRCSPAVSPIAGWSRSSASPILASIAATSPGSVRAAHFVHYFVSRGRLLNFVGWTEHDTWNREDWTDRATIDRALAAFAGWHPQVRRIIAAAETCFIWALFDRDPLPRWSIGRTTLLGDACHPMYPFMGQGAAQAIEDGAALAACLAAGSDDPAAALQRYEQLRLPRVSRLQAMSRANKTPLPYARRPGAAGARRRVGARRRPSARQPALAIRSRPRRAHVG